MFKRILIANRGEIAVRILRTCRDLGVVSVAVYSEADADALHTQIADESICIGPAPARESYLNPERIISAAMAIGADAIHPGYGFLSENAAFAEMVINHGMAFIGPTPETLRLLGEKTKALETAAKAGVPVVPGSGGLVRDLDQAREVAETIGYPLMIKAAMGGGGKGIRLVNRVDELVSAFNAARAEALSSFASDGLYMEKYIQSPRHIEIQVLGDKRGNLVHLFERECSIQRRHQKLIEESPSPFLTPELRADMGAAAVRIARAAGYYNAGTVEFLVDADRNYYFMEMNPRIQVEHPVTEWVTGLDLVAEQIRVAAGQKLSVTQEDLKQSGHAIECRINAEDPSRHFAPCPGLIMGLNFPGGPGVRVDSAVYQGYTVPPYYDSLLAKLIVHGRDRAEAMARTRRALAELLFEGIHTTVDYQLQILRDMDFIHGDFTIDYLESHHFDAPQ